LAKIAMTSEIILNTVLGLSVIASFPLLTG